MRYETTRRPDRARRRGSGLGAAAGGADVAVVADMVLTPGSGCAIIEVDPMVAGQETLPVAQPARQTFSLDNPRELPYA